MPQIIGPFPLDGVRMPTWLLRFDKRGICTSPQTRTMLLDHLQQQPSSDVILFSHGWNNDFDDATALYARFLREFEKFTAAQPPQRPGAGFAPIFIGVTWPSIWLSFDSGPRIASADEPGAAPEDTDLTDNPTVQALADAIATGQGEAALERFYTLLTASRLDSDQARELAALAAPALSVLYDEETHSRLDNDAEALLAAMQALQKAGADPTPAADPNQWGGGDAAQPPTATPADNAQLAGVLDFLDPRQLVRLASVYQMKDRAGVVGANGVAALLRDLLAAVPATTRVHALGHSYGCKVMLSALCVPAPVPRPLSSLLLLQPAVSHLCFADGIPAAANKPGGYRSALERALPPILSTYSKNDNALHTVFHLALRRDSDIGEIGIAAADTSAGKPPSKFAALGGYGPRRAGERLVDPMPKGGEAYGAFGAEPIVGLDGSRGLISGHGDVTSSATAWALYRLVTR